MPTFKEQQQKLVDAQHKLAVWEFLFSVLDNDYVSKDGRQVEKAIKVPDCLVDIVSEDTIEEILSEVTSHIQGYQGLVYKIENAEITVMEPDDDDGRKPRQEPKPGTPNVPRGPT